jgi:hypothetical protein
VDNPWGCDPHTNAGCDTDSATDWACEYGTIAYAGFYCYGSSTEPLGAPCDAVSGPWCAGTMTCVDSFCQRYCCGDEDCPTGEACALPDPYWEWVTGDNLGLCSYTCVRYVDASTMAGPDADGLGWSTAFLTIQEGIDAAAAMVASADSIDTCQVWVTGGQYEIHDGADADTLALADGVEVYGGFVGDETTLDARDWRTNETILLGTNTETSEKVYHVVTALDVDYALIDGFTITGGSADSGSDDDTYGGGVFVDSSNVTINNCIIRDNYAYNWGGGVFVYYGSASISSCQISNNSCDNRGGGLYTNGSPVDIVNCTVWNNDAYSEGGGLYDFNYGDTNIINGIFWANSPDQIFSDSSSYAVDVDRTCVEGGYSDGTNIITADPSFVSTADLTDPDLHLSGTSECIDFGAGDVAPTVDLDGLPRHDHTSHDNDGTGTPSYVDLGAYENQG